MFYPFRFDGVTVTNSDYAAQIQQCYDASTTALCTANPSKSIVDGVYFKVHTCSPTIARQNYHFAHRTSSGRPLPNMSPSSPTSTAQGLEHATYISPGGLSSPLRALRRCSALMLIARSASHVAALPLARSCRISYSPRNVHVLCTTSTPTRVGAIPLSHSFSILTSLSGHTGCTRVVVKTEQQFTSTVPS